MAAKGFPNITDLNKFKLLPYYNELFENYNKGELYFQSLKMDYIVSRYLEGYLK